MPKLLENKLLRQGRGVFVDCRFGPKIIVEHRKIPKKYRRIVESNQHCRWRNLRK